MMTDSLSPSLHVAKDRPILFSASMVRAILDGRKTQTRRVVKFDEYRRAHGEPRPDDAFVDQGGPGNPYAMDGEQYLHVPHADESTQRLYCPHGQPLDRLWVRETMRRRDDGFWVYGADTEVVPVPVASMAAAAAWAHQKGSDTCVSIHMPRWASRLTLEVTGVRVERVQDISESDAMAEGVPCDLIRGDSATPWGPLALMNFGRLWDSINGKRPGCSWDANPWVWVVSFRRVEAAREVPHV